MILWDILTGAMTESDNRTHDLFKYLAVMAIVVALGLESYSVVKRLKPFDMQNFGIGVGTLLAGIGVALKLKPQSTTATTQEAPRS